LISNYTESKPSSYNIPNLHENIASMSLTWLSLALLSTAISALVNTLDSHFLTRRMPSLRSYLLIIGAFTILVGLGILAIFPPPLDIGWQPYAAMLVSSATRVSAVFLMLYAMKREDVARVIPLSSTAPIFVAIMAVFFLGEQLVWLQWLAILVVVGGAILISFKRDKVGGHSFHASSFFMLIGSSLLYAIGDVTNKYAMDYISFWTSAGLMMVFTSGVFVFTCLRGSVVQEIRSLPRPFLTSLAVIGNQIGAIAATLLGFWAIQNGPVSLASPIFNSKPLFVFLYALIFGWLAPGFLLAESSEKKGLLRKLLATLMIVGGIVVIVTA
jgi:drug/metabolite transporter (DMT)-like permease